MYQLTNHDKWLVGRIHQHLDHDCNLTLKGFCEVYERLENAFCWTKDDEMKVVWGAVKTDRSEGDMSTPVSV
jgi:hypothetical protein